MRFRSVLTAFALVAAAPALADTTAVYSTPDGEMTMTIEIAANGDVRGEIGGKMLDELRGKAPGAMVPSFITRAGEGYFLQPGADRRPVVVRVSDAVAIMAEEMPKHRNDFPTVADRPAPTFVERGAVTVHGRAGIAYAVAGSKVGDKPQFVISSDPALSELRDAMARQFEMSLTMGQSIGLVAGGGPTVDLLRKGAPLRFAGIELISVSHESVAPARFALPAEPATRDAVRALWSRKDGDAAR